MMHNETSRRSRSAAPPPARRLIGVALATALALTGCAGQGQQKDQGSSKSGGRVTVTFWNGFTGPDRAALEDLVKKYNASQSKVTVNMEISPWDVFYQKLLPSIGAGKGPDLMAMDSVQLPQYASRGVLRPMDSFYSDSKNETDKLVKAAVDATNWQGKRYGVPMNFTTLLLYWNKQMFKDAGVDPNTPPKTWDDFQADAKKLTQDTNNDGKPEQYGIALADHATVAMWPILFWGNGGGVVSDDGKKSMLGDPKTIQAMQSWGDLVRNQHISPVGLGGADADKLFQTKKAAMEIVGPWMTTGFRDAGIDFGLAAPPAGPAGPVTLGTSVSFAVNAKTSDAKAQAAQDFIKFWNTKDSQKSWALGSGFPPNRTDISATDLKDNPYVVSFGEPAGTSKFYLANVKEYTKVNDTVFTPALQKVLSGQGTAQDLFPKASAELQQVLDSQG
jgi:multiple sugar transport system substrate-binding protein